MNMKTFSPGFIKANYSYIGQAAQRQEHSVMLEHQRSNYLLVT